MESAKRGVLILIIILAVTLIFLASLIILLKQRGILFGPALGGPLTIDKIFLNATDSSNDTNQNLTLYINATGSGAPLIYVGDWYKNGIPFTLAPLWNKKEVFFNITMPGDYSDIYTDAVGNSYAASGGYFQTPNDPTLYPLTWVGKYDAEGNLKWSFTSQQYLNFGSDKVHVLKRPNSNLIYFVYLDRPNSGVYPLKMLVLNENNPNIGTFILNTGVSSLKTFALDSENNLYAEVYLSPTLPTILKFNGSSPGYGNIGSITLPSTSLYDGQNYNHDADSMKIKNNYIYVTAHTPMENFLAKYTTQGTQIWNKSLIYSTEQLRKSAIDADAFGNAYLFTAKGNLSSQEDSFEINIFDSNGNKIRNWNMGSLHIPGTISYSQFAVNKLGESYVLLPDNESGLFGMRLLKFNTTGEFINQAKYYSENSSIISSFNIDSFGNIYFIGTIKNATNYPEKNWFLKIKDKFIKENQAPGQLNLADTIYAKMLNAGDNWSACARVSDGTDYSSEACSNTLLVLESPWISILSPLNDTYPFLPISFSIATTKLADWCGFTLDGADNVTMVRTANGVFTKSVDNIPNGAHSLIFWCNDSSGSWSSAGISFEVQVNNNNADTTPPSLQIISPQPIYYNTRTILVNISATDSNLDKVWFFNGTANETYSLPVYRTFSDGSNTLIAYANDTFGNKNSTTVSFIIDSSQSLITIISPLNQTYDTTTLDFNISLNGKRDICDFNLDNSTNVKLNKVNDTYFAYTKTSLAEGSHDIIFSCEDISAIPGIISAPRIAFTISLPVSPPPGGNGGNGGGGGNGGATTGNQTNQTTTCTPSWSCTDWSSCVEGRQTRTCRDLNNCGISGGKPSEEKECGGSSSTQTGTNQSTLPPAGSTSNIKTILTIIILMLSIFILSVLILLLVIKRGQTKKRKKEYVLNYMKTNLAKGYALETIKNLVKQYGYSEEIIKECEKQLDKDKLKLV